MALIANIGVVVAAVQAEQHEHGIWADLTRAQTTAIRHLIADDDLGRVTRTEILERFHRIARITPEVRA